MKNKILIMIVLALFLIMSVSASLCYQESATVSTACGGLNTGNYSSGGNWNDGNWSTYTNLINPSYINYSTPILANNSLLQVSWRIDPFIGISNSNVSTSLCWNSSKIQLKIEGDITEFGYPPPTYILKCTYQMNLYCFNGSWKKIYSESQTDWDGTCNLGTRLYEEAMIWNIEGYEEEPIDCDYYIGDSAFNLPQIDIQGTYTNDATHQSYLACLYNLDGTGNYEVMNLTNKCKINPQSFNPISVGNHTYTLDIAYMNRVWNPSTHIWETTSSGTDNSLNYTFTVCNIPSDTGGFSSFISWILSLLCNWFGWFC